MTAATVPSQASRWPKALRVAIIVGWLAVYGSHIADWLSSALGLVPRRDPATVIEAHLNSNYLYDVLHGDQVIGRLRSSIGYASNDGVYRQNLVLNLDRADAIPGTGLLIAQFADPSDALKLSVTTTSDYAYRLRSLRATGSIGELEGELVGGVDHKGFRGRAKARSLGIDKPLAFPALGMQASHGAVGLIALPAGLEPGESFVVNSTSFQVAPPGLVDVESTYRVGDPATCPVLPSRNDLMPVAVMRDEQTVVTLWSDQRGIVWAATSPTMPLAIRLRQMVREGEDPADMPVGTEPQPQTEPEPRPETESSATESNSSDPTPPTSDRREATP